MITDGTPLLSAGWTAEQNWCSWPPRRIAVIRALNLGDLLQSVPALRALRGTFPNAEITLIGLPWAEGFCRRFGHYIDRFVTFPGYPGIVETEYDPERTTRFFKDQHAYGYDLAIQMHGSGNASNGFTRELGSAITCGFYDERSTVRLDTSQPYPDRLPEAERNLELVRQLGCVPTDSRLEFPLFPEDEHEAATLIGNAAGRPLIGIHVGARAPSRRWPPERYARVVDDLVDKTGGTVILTGGGDEVDQVDAVRSITRHRTLNLAGTTSLGGLAALIAKLDLFLSNDTGPAHIARALDTPSVTVFGPADPIRWAPEDRARHRIVRRPVHCSPCAHWECPIDHRCLQWIPASHVLAEATDLLSNGRTECTA